MRRADRLFQLVQLLRSRRLATADFLADALGVSKRTVYRDIRDLERSGVPVRGEAGVGYQLERGYELPPLTFNAAEIEALVFGLRMAEAHGDPDLANGARSAMAKVAAALPAPLRALMVETPLFAPHRADRSRDCLALWRRGIAERRKLALDYVDRGYLAQPQLALRASRSDAADFAHMYGMAIFAAHLSERVEGPELVRRTWTAVTLYSGQSVAQSANSVVTTLVPVPGKWKVV